MIALFNAMRLRTACRPTAGVNLDKVRLALESMGVEFISAPMTLGA